MSAVLVLPSSVSFSSGRCRSLGLASDGCNQAVGSPYERGAFRPAKIATLRTIARRIYEHILYEHGWDHEGLGAFLAQSTLHKHIAGRTLNL